MSKGAYLDALDLVRPDFERVEKKLEALIATQSGYLSADDMAFYRKGKKLRPLLTLLSAHAASREPIDLLPDKAISAAATIEMAHVGSLIHDDIVDQAATRRGLPTIAAARGHELAVILGDLQLVEATREMANFVKTESDLELMRRYLEAGRMTCRGQLDEMLAEQPGDWHSLLRRYFRTIDRKTGRLIEFACEGGARLAPDPAPDVLSPLKRFGMLLGRAFQVMDDVLDVVRPSEAAGKEQLIDLAQGRLSLPILYTIAESPEDHFIQNLITGEALDDSQLSEAQTLVREGNGWIKALGDARSIIVKSSFNLRLLPDTPHRTALGAIADHVVNQSFLDDQGN